MITAHEILNLNLDKIDFTALRAAVEKWIEDYNASSDKDAFVKESKENMNQLMEMVGQYAPKALTTSKSEEPKLPPTNGKPKAEKQQKAEKEETPKKQPLPSANGKATTKSSKEGMGKKMAKVLMVVIGDFEGILEELKASDLEAADLIIFIEMTEKLEKASQSGDEKEVLLVLDEILDDFIQWQQKMQQSENQDHRKASEKATDTINKLLQEAGIPTIEQKVAEKKEYKALTKELVEEVIDELAKVQMDATPIIMQVVLNARNSLEKALEKTPKKVFKSAVEDALGRFAYYARDLEDTTEKRLAINSINRLRKVLNIPPLTRSGAIGKKSRSNKHGKASPKGNLTKEMITTAIDKIAEIGKKVKGKDAELIYKTKELLEGALSEKTYPGYRKVVEYTISRFQVFVDEMSKSQTRNDAITTINTLSKATGQPLLSQDAEIENESPHEQLAREIAILRTELENCQAEEDERTRKRRKQVRKKNKKKLSWKTKLSIKLLSITGLIPSSLKNDMEVLKATEPILIAAYRDLVKLWSDEKAKTTPGADLIREGFSELEEKAKEKAKTPKGTEKPDTKKKKEKTKLKIDLEYRDGANYKTHFEHEVDLITFPEAKRLKKGDEITMGDFGTPLERDFFGSNVHPHSYNEEHDHNILRIKDIHQ